MDVIAMLGPLGRMLLSQLSTNKQKGKCPMGKFSGRANNAFFLVLNHQGKKYELSRRITIHKPEASLDHQQLNIFIPNFKKAY